MDIINTLIMSIASVLVLFILTKIMGYREISQFSMFDYITGISMGSMAAEMATDIENFEKPLIAIIIYGLVGVSISILTNKSYKLRKRLMGKPIILLNDGIIFYDRMKKAKLDVSELLMELRVRGYFNITQIKTVVLEVNGKFSIIPFNEDENLKDIMCVNLIMDGEIVEENLIRLGLEKGYIYKKIYENGFDNIKNIFLAVFIENEIKFFKKEFSSGDDNYVF